jgi:thiol-disulfide isomerase/thioredoxin
MPGVQSAGSLHPWRGLARRTITVASLMMVASVLSAATPAEEKLNVYVNPLEFEQRIPRLAIGDPAPKLAVDRWMQGTPITHFERGRVYVLEFWASWCQPCRKSLPQVDALAKRYRGRDLQVIGVAAAEDSGASSKLESFLSERKLSYPIAFRSSSDMYDSWVRAARGSGLPWVFVVDRNGKIAWWGQPFYEAFDGVLDAVLAGTWDATREQTARVARQADERRGWQLRQDATDAAAKQDWPRARRDLDALVALDPERWWWEVVERVNVTARGLKQPAEAKDLAAQAIHGVSKDNPHALTALAGILLRAEDPAGRDTSLAVQAAERANTLTLGADADVVRLLEAAKGRAKI